MSRCSRVGSRPEVRRADDHVRPAARLAVGEQRLLQVLALRRALLDEVGVRDRLLDRRSTKRERPCAGHAAPGSAGAGPAGIGEHLADLALDLGIGVEDHHVEAVPSSARRPAGADDAGADQADLPDAPSACPQPELRAHLVRPEHLGRSSAQDLAARVTSAPLEALTPREPEIVLQPDPDVAARSAACATSAAACGRSRRRRTRRRPAAGRAWPAWRVGRPARRRGCPCRAGSSPVPSIRPSAIRSWPCRHGRCRTPRAPAARPPP